MLQIEKVLIAICGKEMHHTCNFVYGCFKNKKNKKQCNEKTQKHKT